MNNSGALYVLYADHHAVASALNTWMVAQGFAAVNLPPQAISGRIMIAQKRRRLFYVLPAAQGWVTIWEDPRYFGDRTLARELARSLDTQAIWIEVSGNGVGWARGHYQGVAVLEEVYEDVETTFYGEYGPVSFVFDMETTPDEWIDRLNLPYAEYHYESALNGDLPADVGAAIFLAFER